MAFVTIDLNKVRTGFTASEETAAKTSDVVVGQSDPLTETISQVTNRVRGAVQSGGYTLEATGIPPSLVGAAIAIIIFTILPRIPLPVTEERKKLYEDAVKLLEQVAEGDFDPIETVEDPLEPDSPREGCWGSEPKINMRTHTDD